ncbi:MAG: hypothetical protein HIU92_02565 [Proteobacteria bacterium]|nr:hypothetical protein [Pseudomonadota bacterium]
MSFVERQITITIKLGQGSYGESGFDTVTLAGYRCSVQIERAAMPGMGFANARIYGMSQSLMNQLSTLGGNPKLNGRLNTLSISAGDAVGGMNQIFEGVISNAWQDYSGMPETCFVAEAFPGMLDLVKPADATSFAGDMNVADILKGMAARMTPALNFQNFGVNVILSNPYFYGCLLDQIRSVFHAANINGEIHNGCLYIWPRNGKRPVAPVTISPANGLVGYPSINGVQVFDLTALFDPTLEYGATVTLSSSLKPACGDWYVGALSHELESLTPGGAWFSSLELWSLSYALSQPGY